jgi:hypothetical protein
VQCVSLFNHAHISTQLLGAGRALLRQAQSVVGIYGGLTLNGVIMAQVSMRDLLQAGAHFGHQTRFWNPKMGNTSLVRVTKFTSSTLSTPLLR